MPWLHLSRPRTLDASTFTTSSPPPSPYILFDSSSLDNALSYPSPTTPTATIDEASSDSDGSVTLCTETDSRFETVSVDSMSNPSSSRAGTAQPEGTPFPSPTQAASTADIPTVDEAVPLPAVGAIPPPDEQAAELLSDAPAAAVPQEEGEEELDVEADVDELAPDTPASSSLSEEEISPSRRFDPRNASEEAYYVKKGWGLPVPESEPLDRSFFGE